MPAAVPRSLVGQLQRIPGTAVFTYDYRDYAARWVDDSHLGPGLGKVVDCLYQASGEKVIIVGHSMGGLAARYAATHPGVAGDADRAKELSTVITFGTPETGSVAALLTATGLDLGARADESRTLATIRFLLSACGQVASNKMQSGSVCDWLPPPIRTFASDAGVALHTGSAQLAALAHFPKSITLDALAGQTTLHLPQPGWFGIPWTTNTATVGDVIVTSGSALNGASLTSVASCAYQLNAYRLATDSIGVTLGLLSKVDTAQQPLAAFSSPCFHTHLMRGIQLTNEATGMVAQDIAARQPLTAADLLSAPVPAACRHKAGRLVDGAQPGIASMQGYMELAWHLQPERKAQTLTFGDLNGDGWSDAATVLSCNAGGVAWPEIAAVYTRDATSGQTALLGSVSLSDINLPGHSPGENAFVKQLRYGHGALETSWTTQQDGDPGANTTLDYHASLKWNGKRLVPSQLTATTEKTTAAEFLTRVRQGDLAGADTLASPGTAVTLQGLLAQSPTATHSTLACYGEISLDAPAALQDWVLAGGLNGADRYCVLPGDAQGSTWARRDAHGRGVGTALTRHVAEQLHAVGEDVAGAQSDNGIGIVRRDSATGALSQSAGLDSCITADGSSNGSPGVCTTGTALGAPNGIVISPDGADVYAITSSSNAIVLLTRTR